MKINFNSTYGEVYRLLNSPLAEPAAAATQRPEFSRLLSSISPSKEQLPGSIAENKNFSAAAGERAPPGDAMARLKPSFPELELPGFERVTVAADPVAESGTGVNSPASGSGSAWPLDPAELGAIPGVAGPGSGTPLTPDIVDARRIPHRDGFASLRKSERIEIVRDLVQTAGAKHGIDPALGMAVVQNESSFDSNAISTDGHRSKGLFQLLDTTGADVLERSGFTSRYNPFDPKLNVELGVSYLRYLHEIFNKATALPNNLTTAAAANSSSLEKLAVAAFNAGEGRVASAQSRALRDGKDPADYDQISAYLPESTREYVQRVIESKPDFFAAERG